MFQMLKKQNLQIELLKQNIESQKYRIKIEINKMGNQGSCCQPNNNQGYIQAQINSIKYNSKIHNMQSKSYDIYTKSNKNVFSTVKNNTYQEDQTRNRIINEQNYNQSRIQLNNLQYGEYVPNKNKKIQKDNINSILTKNDRQVNFRDKLVNQLIQSDKKQVKQQHAQQNQQKLIKRYMSQYNNRQGQYNQQTNAYNKCENKNTSQYQNKSKSSYQQQNPQHRLLKKTSSIRVQIPQNHEINQSSLDQQSISTQKKYNQNYIDNHKKVTNIQADKSQINRNSIKAQSAANLKPFQSSDQTLNTNNPNRHESNLTFMKRTNSSKQKQIVVQYLQTVKKVILRQGPLQKELKRIPKQKIKIIRINNGQDIYKGQVNYYQKPHGYGVLIKSNGNVLISDFNNGLASGPSYYIFSDGSYYKGKMADNFANDQLGQFHTHKLTYIGGFLDNLFHGKGKQLGPNHYFEGIYNYHRKKQGILKWGIRRPKGKSSSKINQSSKSIESSRLQQSINRFNQINWPDYQQQNPIPPVRSFAKLPQYQYIYQGKFDKNQKYTGKGKLKDPLGQYIGDFVQGEKHGKGQYTFQNELKYVGEYKDNRKQGFGALYNCDNTLSYEGYWKNDLPDGKGVLYDYQGNRNYLQFIQGICKMLAPQQV